MTSDITYKIIEDGKRYRFNYRVAAIIEVQGKILLNKFVAHDYYFLPGGRVKLDETAQEALLRELQEELNIHATIISLPFVIENFFDYDGESFHELNLVFKVDSTGLSLPEDGEIQEKVQFHWCHAAQIAALNLKPDLLRTVLQNIPNSTKHIMHRDS